MNELENVDIDAVGWLEGSWRGSFGAQSVEEHWQRSDDQSMDTMVHLSGDNGVFMLELIVIRASVSANHDPTLTLHLRQFTPTLELVTTQDMPLVSLCANSVAFGAEPPAGIRRLSYTLRDAGDLEVGVTVATGEVLTAQLHRH